MIFLTYSYCQINSCVCFGVLQHIYVNYTLLHCFCIYSFFYVMILQKITVNSKDIFYSVVHTVFDRFLYCPFQEKSVIALFQILLFVYSIKLSCI